MTRPGVDDERRALLGELFGAFGAGSVLKPSFRCDYGNQIFIGEDAFINYDCVFLDCNRITIGREVQIAPRVQIYTATHPFDAATRRSKLEFALPVEIKDGAWLGGGVIVCPGVTVGENTVVGRRQRRHPRPSPRSPRGRQSLPRASVSGMRRDLIGEREWTGAPRSPERTWAENDGA